MRRLGAVLGTVVVTLFALAPASALGYSGGAMTKSVATGDWSHGSFAATVNAAPCGSGICSYSLVAFAQPSLPEYGCRSEEFFDNDKNTQQVSGITGGDIRTANATFEASATNVSILNGVYGQRFCLELIGEREVPDVVCERQREALEEFEKTYGGSGKPITCPPRKVIFGEAVAGAVMSVETAPAVPAPAASPSPVAPVTTPAPPCRQGAATVANAWLRVAKARKGLKSAKRHHRPTKARKQAWEREKAKAKQTEKQQHELCGS
jgi:hypothetical protein